MIKASSLKQAEEHVRNRFEVSTAETIAEMKAGGVSQDQIDEAIEINAQGCEQALEEVRRFWSAKIDAPPPTRH